MNAKQTAPLVATLPAIAAAAPPLIIVGAISVGGFFLLKWLLSDDKEKKPENSGGNASVPPTPAPVPANYILIPAKKKFITRQDMAKIFNSGRGLTRKSAVAALTALGFGKTAAYEALSPDGRFASWLQFAPDGIIGWKNLP